MIIFGFYLVVLLEGAAGFASRYRRFTSYLY